MKSVLHLVKQFLARHPGFRRKVVNVIYRIPALDMRLRATLDKPDNPTWRRLDINDLPEEIRAVYQQLRDELTHR